MSMLGLIYAHKQLGYLCTYVTTSITIKPSYQFVLPK